ncbi:MAG: hypothetical protein H6684_09240 [Deltaproteobacteria bacterium]|nr:hypothetical protein [Deltaproteobacteria bacterium]
MHALATARRAPETDFRLQGPDASARNFQDSEWQKSVTDEHIEKIIKYGGAAVGKSPMMPANPDLSAKDEVAKALRVHIRELSNS